MREQFSCFYNDESDSYLKPIWEDEKTLFVFDTNVLIDLYSFQPESREDFFKVLDKLKDRIWIPYHVGLEFQRRRLDIIKQRREHFAKIYKDVDDLNNTLSFDQKKFTTLTTQLITKKIIQNYLKKYTKFQILLQKK
jgi:predicted nucleic acid-binding protein